MCIDSKAPRIQAEPAHGALTILDTALRRRVMDALNPVLGRGRDEAAGCKILRRGRELRGTASRAATAEEQDNSGPAIARLPVGWEIKIDFQISLRRGLIYRHGFVVDRIDI